MRCALIAFYSSAGAREAKTAVDRSTAVASSIAVALDRRRRQGVEARMEIFGLIRRTTKIKLNKIGRSDMDGFFGVAVRRVGQVSCCIFGSYEIFY